MTPKGLAPRRTCASRAAPRTTARPWIRVGAAIGRPQSRPAITQRQCKYVPRFHVPYSHRPVLSCRFHRGRAMLAPTRCIAAGTYLAVGAAIGRPQSRPASTQCQCKSVPRFPVPYSHRPVLSCRFHRGRAMLAPTRWTAPYCSKSAAFRSAKLFLSDSFRRSGPLTS